MFEYRLRPGYKSTNVLLEFSITSDDESFITILLDTFSTIDIRIENIADIWMNDEILIDLVSTAGKFTLSKDVWGFVFILADENQDGLLILDDCLKKSGRFVKIDVNYSDYQ